MGSSAPPPSQSGIPSQGNNNVTYILLAIVLLLGIGGIVTWKLRSTETPPPPPTQGPVASASASASAGPQSAILDDIPPPPPVEDSGPQARFSGGNSGPYDPCSATTCYGGVKPGSDTERGLAVLSMQTRRKCYNPALGNDPTLKGKVVLRMKIAGNGQICAANVESNTMSSSSVADCAARVLLASGHVPAPGGNCVNLDLPLNYVPMGGQ